MTRRICAALLLTLTTTAMAWAAGDQAAIAARQTVGTGKKVRIIYYHPPRKISAAMMARIRTGVSTSQTIPLWNFNATAYDGSVNPGNMVGRSPFAHVHRTTQIPTFVVPIILKITNGQGQQETFDPTQPNPCAANGESTDTLLVNSPIFQTTDFVINGVDVGTTQYLDAFQRANFWKLVQGTPYHTTFTTTPTILPAVTVVVPAASGIVVPRNELGTCSDFGLMDINFWLPLAENTIVPNLAASGAGPMTFPQLIFDSVGLTQGQPINKPQDPTNPLPNCCILGFHDAFANGSGTLVTYSSNDYDNSGLFGTNTDVLSHEVAEWMDDPTGANGVPAWGNEGQVVGTCQNNLEVGDPLSESFGTPTNPFSVPLNGTTYNLQELAFYSWFIGDVPSLGAGGGYSDNGTFTGHAKGCPPGGTN